MIEKTERKNEREGGGGGESVRKERGEREGKVDSNGKNGKRERWGNGRGEAEGGKVERLMEIIERERDRERERERERESQRERERERKKRVKVDRA